MRLSQPIKQYEILIETHPSGLIQNRMRKLSFTGTRQEAQDHLNMYVESHHMHAYKAYLREIR